MRVENPQAYRFIMQDELYLLEKDKLTQPLAAETNSSEEQPQIIQATDNVNPAADILPVQPQPVAPVISQPIQQTPELAFKYLGDNKKSFLILVNYENEEHIAASHLIALESILSRKQLSIADVAVLNVNKHAPVKLAALTGFFSPTRLVIMGKDAMPEGIGNLAFNKAIQGKKIHVLYSFSFDEMMSSNENKKAFWEQMKTL